MALITVCDSFDVEIPAIITLVECLSKNSFQSPTHASQSAFDYAFGASFFDWMKENPATLGCFDLYMAGRRVGKASWLEYYPIHERLIKGTKVENAIFMVDIGGGHGHDLKSLRDRYGHEGLPGRLILQDLAAETTEDTRTIFESMLHNFFEPQPVKGMSAPKDLDSGFPKELMQGFKDYVLSPFSITDSKHQPRRPYLLPPSDPPRLAHTHMPHHPLPHRRRHDAKLLQTHHSRIHPSRHGCAALHRLY